MTNKEKYLQKIAGKESDEIKEAKWRVENHAWIRESKKMALKILLRLDELNWTQKELAVRLGKSPQYVNKLLSGNTKFGFEVIVQLQDILKFPLLNTYQREEEIESKSFSVKGKLVKLAVSAKHKSSSTIHTAKEISMNFNMPSQTYSYKSM